MVMHRSRRQVNIRKKTEFAFRIICLVTRELAALTALRFREKMCLQLLTEYGSISHLYFTVLYTFSFCYEIIMNIGEEINVPKY
jgi:hypothetical protein